MIRHRCTKGGCRAFLTFIALAAAVGVVQFFT